MDKGVFSCIVCAMLLLSFTQLQTTKLKTSHKVSYLMCMHNILRITFAAIGESRMLMRKKLCEMVHVKLYLFLQL